MKKLSFHDLPARPGETALQFCARVLDRRGVRLVVAPDGTMIVDAPKAPAEARVTLRTWHVETLVVAALLAASALAAGGRRLDWLSAAAVLLSFGHASIADRLAEREAARAVPSVHCVRWLQAYWVAKEALWVAVFIVGHVWPALVGCAVFLAHPVWRRWYRARKPLAEAT